MLPSLSKILEHLVYNQAVLDTVHVTNFVQSPHCRRRTGPGSLFDFRRLSSDLRLYFLEKFE